MMSSSEIGVQPPVEVEDLEEETEEHVSRLQMAKRHEATERERRRMRLLNEAFQVLQEILPSYSRPNRMPKYDCLRLAIRYIKDLREVLRQAEREEAGDAKANCYGPYGPTTQHHFGLWLPPGQVHMCPSSSSTSYHSSIMTPSGLPCPVRDPLQLAERVDHGGDGDKTSDVDGLQSTLPDSPSVSEIVWHDLVSTLSPSSVSTPTLSPAWQPHRFLNDSGHGYSQSGWHFPMLCMPFVRH